LAVLASAGAGVGLTAIAGASVPTQWTYQIVAAEERPGFPALGIPSTAQLSGQTPAIDEDGSAVARWSGLTSGVTGLTVFNATNGSSMSIASTPPDSEGFAVTTTDVDIRNGRIGWKQDDGIHIYDLSGNQLNLLGPSGPLGTWSGPSKFTLTDAGAAGLRASFNGVPTLFIDQPGPPRAQQIVWTQTSPITFLSAMYMNQSGQFGGTVFEGSVRAVERFQAGQAPVTLFSTAAGGYTDVANQTDINDAGEVAFFAKRTDATDTRGFRWELRVGTAPATSRLVIDDRHPDLVTTNFINFSPDLANNGLIALHAKFGAGDGVFVTDGVDLVRLAGATDTITTTNLGAVTVLTVTGGVSQNERNQVAFHADLTNGATVLVIATPVPTTPTCRADYNGQNGVDLLDIFAFLNDWFAGNARADFNGMNGVDLLDIFAFLSAWFAGC
jgi:hypothetical protein